MHTVLSRSASLYLCIQGALSCAVICMASVGAGILRFTIYQSEWCKHLPSVFSDVSVHLLDRAPALTCRADTTGRGGSHIPVILIDHG